MSQQLLLAWTEGEILVRYSVAPEDELFEPDASDLCPWHDKSRGSPQVEIETFEICTDCVSRCVASIETAPFSEGHAQHRAIGGGRREYE